MLIGDKAVIIPVDKEKILQEFKDKYVNNRFINEIPKINKKIEKNEKVIKNEILLNFNKVCENAKNLQNQNLKKEIKFIYISFLRTSLLENKGIWRIDLFDENWFLDKEECFINLDFSFIYENLFNFIEELQEKKKEYGRAITEMDVEKIKLQEGDKYHNLIMRFFENKINELIECENFKEMNKHNELMIFTGEYMDEVELLYESLSEEMKKEEV